MLAITTTMLRNKRTFSSIVVIIMMAAVAVAIASRQSTEREPPLNTSSFDGRVTIGAVLDLRHEAGREAQRGLRLWKEQIDLTQGIQVNMTQVVPVDLRFRDSGSSASEAAAQARRLVQQGVGILVGPLGAEQIEAVAQVALDTHTMMISLNRRPTSVPRNRLLTFLSRPELGSFSTTFDALDVSTQRKEGRGDTRIRVAVVAPTGRWATRARSVHLVAQSRGYASTMQRFPGSDPGPALRRARAFHPNLIVVVAPFQDSYRWFRSQGLRSDPPWTVAAGDVSAAQAVHEGSPLAVSAPWSPTNIRGGPIFAAGQFRTMYADAYGGLATIDAAAGAAGGIVISEAVTLARSTDVTRLLAARDRLRSESLWGALRFVKGEQVTGPPSAVLLTRDGPRSIGPEPADPRQLLRSRPQVPAVPAAEPATVGQVSPNAIPQP